MASSRRGWPMAAFPTLPRAGPGRQRPPYPSRRLTPPLVALTPPAPSGPACTGVRGRLAWRMAPVPLPEPICLICSEALAIGHPRPVRARRIVPSRLPQLQRHAEGRGASGPRHHRPAGGGPSRGRDGPAPRGATARRPKRARARTRDMSVLQRARVGERLAPHRELGSRLPKEAAVQEGTKCRRRSIDAAVLWNAVVRDRFTRTRRPR
jgi:hypothetical protein